jgi:hypothetical protein
LPLTQPHWQLAAWHWQLPAQLQEHLALQVVVQVFFSLVIVFSPLCSQRVLRFHRG